MNPLTSTIDEIAVEILQDAAAAIGHRRDNAGRTTKNFEVFAQSLNASGFRMVSEDAKGPIKVQTCDAIHVMQLLKQARLSTATTNAEIADTIIDLVAYRALEMAQIAKDLSISGAAK